MLTLLRRSPKVINDRQCRLNGSGGRKNPSNSGTVFANPSSDWDGMLRKILIQDIKFSQTPGKTG